MQKKSLYILPFAALMMAGLAACSSTHTVQTKDGSTIVTDDKPEVDKDTGLVQYENAETGKKEQINKDQIKSMKDVDD